MVFIWYLNCPFFYTYFNLNNEIQPENIKIGYDIECRENLYDVKIMPEDDFVLSKRHSYVSVENLLINVLFFTIVLILLGGWLMKKLIIRVVGVLFLVDF